jgi:hypothetical protein
MKFRIMGQLKLKGASRMPATPPQPERRNPRLSTEETCRACDLFCAPQTKCAHPRSKSWSVCYGSPLRVQPWKGLICPLKP